MGFWKEFETFAMRGNMVDMAVGIIVGASFTKMVTSMVNDVLMPPLGLLIGGMDFSDFSLTIPSPIPNGSPVTIQYGAFFNTLVSFLIVAFVVFLVIKGMNSLASRLKQEEDISSKTCPECCMEIPKEAKRCGHCGVRLTS